MKKVLSVFLIICLLLPGIALAEVQSQVSTPAEYKGTHNSPSGKSHIYVDAQVVVPEAKTIPIYQVFARVPDEMDFKLLANLTFEAYIGDKSETGFRIDARHIPCIWIAVRVAVFYIK